MAKKLLPRRCTKRRVRLSGTQEAGSARTTLHEEYGMWWVTAWREGGQAWCRQGFGSKAQATKMFRQVRSHLKKTGKVCDE